MLTNVIWKEKLKKNKRQTDKTVTIIRRYDHLKNRSTRKLLENFDEFSNLLDTKSTKNNNSIFSHTNIHRLELIIKVHLTLEEKYKH